MPISSIVKHRHCFFNILVNVIDSYLIGRKECEILGKFGDVEFVKKSAKWKETFPICLHPYTHIHTLLHKNTHRINEIQIHLSRLTHLLNCCFVYLIYLLEKFLSFFIYFILLYCCCFYYFYVIPLVFSIIIHLFIFPSISILESFLRCV